MRWLRGAWIEARALQRRSWIGLVGGLAGWLLLVRWQQPAGVQHGGAPFYWASAEAGLLLVLAVLPLVWLLVRRGSATAWTLRAARRPFDAVLVAWLGIVSYAVAVALLAALLSVTVERIFGDSVETARGGLLLAGALLFALPWTALAPGLAYLSLPTHATALVWSLLLAGSLLRGFPVPTGSLLILQRADPTMTALAMEAAPAAILATAGCLLFSLALARRRLGTSHAHRHPG